MNLQEIQKFLSETYPNDNVSVNYIVEKIVANCGLIASNHSEGWKDDFPFVEVTAWIIALSTKGGAVFWEEIIKQYPNCCRKCLGIPCICETTGGVPKDYGVAEVKQILVEQSEIIIRSIRQGPLKDGDDKSDLRSYTSRDTDAIPYISAPPNLDQIMDMFSNIYPLNDNTYKHNQNYFFRQILRGNGRICASLIKSESDKSRERILTDSIRLYAWIISFWRLSKKGDASFSPTRSFLKRYDKGCPICDSKPCECGDNKYNRFTSFELAASNSRTNDPREEFRAQIAELNKALSEGDLDQIPEETAEKPKKELLEELDKRRKQIEALDKASGNAENVAKRLARLAGWVAEYWPF